MRRLYVYGDGGSVNLYGYVAGDGSSAAVAAPNAARYLPQDEFDASWQNYPNLKYLFNNCTIGGAACNYVLNPVVITLARPSNEIKLEVNFIESIRNYEEEEDIFLRVNPDLGGRY